MGNRSSGEIKRNYEKDEPVILVTPEVFPEDRVERRLQMISVQVPADDPSGAYEYDPMEVAAEKLAQRAKDLGANTVMAVEAFALNKINARGSGTARASGYHGGRSIYLDVPNPGRIESDPSITVWGMAVVLS